VYEVGTEPDPRFRPGQRTHLPPLDPHRLALIASGIALQALALPIQRGPQTAAAILLPLLGLVVPALAWLTWARVEHQLRRSAPLPGSHVALPVAVGVTAAGILLLIGILLR
jgi:putative membrane protein